MMDAAVLRNQIDKGREGGLARVEIPLIGRVEGDTGSRHHLQAIINEIDSNLNVRWCI